MVLCLAQNARTRRKKLNDQASPSEFSSHGHVSPGFAASQSVRRHQGDQHEQIALQAPQKSGYAAEMGLCRSVDRGWKLRTLLVV